MYNNKGKVENKSVGNKFDVVSSNKSNYRFRLAVFLYSVLLKDGSLEKDEFVKICNNVINNPAHSGVVQSIRRYIEIDKDIKAVVDSVFVDNNGKWVNLFRGEFNTEHMYGGEFKDFCKNVIYYKPDIVNGLVKDLKGKMFNLLDIYQYLLENSVNESFMIDGEYLTECDRIDIVMEGSVLRRENMKLVNSYPDLGYEVYSYDSVTDGFDPVPMVSAFNMNGDYIGDEKIAKMLCDKCGIKPELANPGDSVCSIGYSEKEGKWFGWSHRAIAGFQVGSEVKQGDVAYIPSNDSDIERYLNNFWNNNPNHYDVKYTSNVIDPYGEQEGLGGMIEYKVKRTTDGKELQFRHWMPYSAASGRGEWTAKTLDDAKQMAIDYANNIG